LILLKKKRLVFKREVIVIADKQRFAENCVLTHAGQGLVGVGREFRLDE